MVYDVFWWGWRPVVSDVGPCCGVQRETAIISKSASGTDFTETGWVDQVWALLGLGMTSWVASGVGVMSRPGLCRSARCGVQREIALGLFLPNLMYVRNVVSSTSNMLLGLFKHCASIFWLIYIKKKKSGFFGQIFSIIEWNRIAESGFCAF